MSRMTPAGRTPPTQAAACRNDRERAASSSLPPLSMRSGVTGVVAKTPASPGVGGVPPALELTDARDEHEPPSLAAPSERSGSARSFSRGGGIRATRQGVAIGCGSPSVRSRRVAYKARPALACIIGARRAWTVEMISSEEMPCRYLH
jgi:hypothetical protein